MTAEEKQAIIEELLTSASNSLDITSLSAAESLEGISTFPAIQATTSGGTTSYALVKVPISLLTQAVQDVIANANTATSAARSAASGWAAAAVKMGSDIVVIEGDISNLQDADKSLSSLTAYAECSTAANVSAKAVTVPFFSLPTNGGCLHVKMANANTAVSGVTLNINATGAKDLLYNGSAVSATNTWEDNEVLQIYYDGTNYQATNAQGGGSADMISFDNSESGLNAETVQEAIEEIANKVDSSSTNGWSGYAGISSISQRNSSLLPALDEYQEQVGVITIPFSSSGYLWVVSSVQVIVVSSGIEIPMNAPATYDGNYYYRSVEEVVSQIDIVVNPLAKQDGGTSTTIIIDTQPIGAEYTVGDTPTQLSVIARTSEGTLSYQWYKGGSEISGATSNTYTPSTSEASNYGYRCKITNSLGGYKWSNYAYVNVSESGGGEGGDDTSDFLENKGVVNGEIVTMNGYSLSPVYEIEDNSDIIYVWTGINNSDNSLKVISVWSGADNGNFIAGYYELNKGRYIQLSASQYAKNYHHIRVMVDAEVIEKCIIYNVTKGEWIYKGSSLGNTYDGVDWLKYVSTQGTYTATLLNSWEATSMVEQSLTHASPLIEIVSGHSLAVKNNVLGYSQNRAMIVFYKTVDNEIVPNLDSTDGNRYYAIVTTGERTGMSTSGVVTHARIFVSAEELHTCYLYDETSGEYLWKGIDVTD